MRSNPALRLCLCAPNREKRRDELGQDQWVFPAKRETCAENDEVDPPAELSLNSPRRTTRPFEDTDYR